MTYVGVHEPPATARRPVRSTIGRLVRAVRDRFREGRRLSQLAAATRALPALVRPRGSYPTHRAPGMTRRVARRVRTAVRRTARASRPARHTVAALGQLAWRPVVPPDWYRRERPSWARSSVAEILAGV